MSGAAKLSKQAAEAYGVGGFADVMADKWMWDADGLAVRPRSCQLAVFARVERGAREMGVYFESYARIADATGFTKRAVTTAMGRLRAAGLIVPVGVRMEEGPAVRRAADPAERINRQCGWIVNHALLDAAAGACPEAVLGALATRERPATCCAQFSTHAQPVVVKQDDGPNEATTCGVENQTAQQPIVVKQDAPAGSETVVVKSAHTAPACGFVEFSTLSTDPTRSCCFKERNKKESLSASGAAHAAAELAGAWRAGGLATGDPALVEGLFPVLLGTGVERGDVLEGARRYVRWVARCEAAGERVRNMWDLVRFCRLNEDGRPNRFIEAAQADRIRREARKAARLRVPSRKSTGAPRVKANDESAGQAVSGPQTGIQSGSPAPAPQYGVEDLRVERMWDGFWHVSTPGGYDLAVVEVSLLSESAPREDVVAWFLAHARSDWRTFSRLGDDDVRFNFDDATGMTTALAANGYAVVLGGRAGSDPRSTRAQLLDEFRRTASPAWRERNGGVRRDDGKGVGLCA